MDSQVLLLNLNNISCRVCFQHSESINSLFDQVDYGDKKLELIDILKRVTNIEIRTDESMILNSICDDCTEKLLYVYDFICSVEKSENYLEKFIKEKQAQDQQFAQIEIVSNDCDDDAQESIEILDDYKKILDISKNGKLNRETLDNYPDSIHVFNIDVINAESEQIIKNEPLNVQEKLPSKRKEKQGSISIGSRLSYFAKANQYKCNHCQRTFAREETLRRHINQAHTCVSAEEIAALTTITGDSVNCLHCPRIFAKKEDMERHAKATHADIIDQDELVKPRNYNYKRGLCPHCGKSFPQASLLVHIRRHTGDKPYKCEECGKGFPRRQDLVVHKRQHTGERPHVCTICGKSFIRPNKLARHVRIHTGVRPYKCPICDKGFSQSNDLKLHHRRHLGEKPYKCGICGEAYISGTALKTHRRQMSHFEPDKEIDPYEVCRVSASLIKVKSEFQPNELGLINK